MEAHAKIIKNSHKNFTSTNPGLKVDQTYAYITASLDLLVTYHCRGNGVIEIKCPETVCESGPSEENLDDYLIKENPDQFEKSKIECGKYK